METFSFELRLIDSVTAASKKAAASVEAIQKRAKKTQEALTWHKEIEKTEAALKKITADPVGLKKYIAAQKELIEQRKKINKAMGKESFGEAFSSKLSLGKMFSAAALGDLFAEGLVEAIKAPIELFAEGIKEAFSAIGAEQQLRAGYELTLGAKGGKEAREEAERFAPKTAFSASQVQEQMLPLFRAGLKGQAARTAYASATDLAAGRGMGADSGAVSEAVALFAKVQQKGGITGKMLSGVGLGQENVPAFFKDLGHTLGVSAKAAEKMASHGGIDPQIISNAITTAINKQQGGMAGTGGEKAGKSLFGRWNKLKAIPEEMFRKLVESPALDKIGATIERVLGKLDPKGPFAKEIFEGLAAAFESVAGFVEKTFTEENIDGFASGLGSVIEFGKTLWSVFRDIFGIASDLGKILGDLGVTAALKVLIDAVGYLVTKLERMLALIDRATAALSGKTDRESMDQYAHEAAKVRKEHPNQFGADGSYMGNAYINGHVITRRRGEMQMGDDLLPSAGSAAGGRGKSVTNHITTGDIHVEGSHSGDPEETGARVKHGIHKAATTAHELAGQQY